MSELTFKALIFRIEDGGFSPIKPDEDDFIAFSGSVPRSLLTLHFVIIIIRHWAYS